MATTLVDEHFNTYPINETNYPDWSDQNTFGTF